MKNVKVEDNRCVIKINTIIYPPQIVSRAAEEFKAFGDVAVEDHSTKVVIIPKNIDKLSNIGYEFFDCLLGIMQNQNQ